jgi:hypothetical protein
VTWIPRRDEARQLRLAGYDGLYFQAGECACKVDDLYPCGERQEDCRPGVLGPCPSDCGDHDWHIVKRPESAQAPNAEARK